MDGPDAFALFELLRQPWLDAGVLKAEFLKRSGATHPDNFTDPAEKETAATRFAALNTAHETLRDPKQRLQHLLTLERGEKPADVNDILPETADLFIKVGQLLQPVDAIIARREAEPSPLLRAQSMPEALDWLEKVNALLDTLNTQLAALESELQSFKDNWDCDTLERLYHRFSYLQKWRGQLNDRAVKLAL